MIAARTLPDDRLESDVVEVVDLPKRLAQGGVGQVDLDERAIDGEERVAQRDARVGQPAGIDDRDVKVALVKSKEISEDGSEIWNLLFSEAAPYQPRQDGTPKILSQAPTKLITASQQGLGPTPMRDDDDPFTGMGR